MSGSWQLSMAGAVATLVCDPGYTLTSRDASQIYCNGRSWLPRTQDPSCKGHYMYIESSSPRKENDFARLYSPVYGQELADDGCFMFWYNMFGTTIGSLKIYVKPQSRPFKDLSPSFQKFGNQGARWFQGIVSLTSVNETFQVIIEATRGNGFLGDIAVDDVAIRKGDDCLVIPDQPITAAIRQDGETATREPLVKSFPTFLPAPPLPDLPPMPPEAEASQAPPPPPPSTFPPPPTLQTATAKVTTTSTTSLKANISTATSVPPFSYRPRHTTSFPSFPGTATIAFSVSEPHTVATERPPTVAATERNKTTFPSSTVGTKYRPVVPAFPKNVTTTPKGNPNGTTSASFNKTSTPTTKLTSALPSTPTKPTVTTAKSPATVTTTKSPPTVTTTKSPPIVLITRTTTTSTPPTTRRPTTSTSVKMTTSKLPVTKVDYKKKLATNTTVALPPKFTKPATTSSTRSKVQRMPTTFKRATTPTTKGYRFLPTTASTTTLLPLPTTGSTKPASPTFQRVVKPRWSSKRRPVKAAPSSGPSAKTIGAVVAVVLTGLLLSVVAFFVVKKRLRQRRQRNVAEDSDVRYLTSDEILDFNLARPADDDA